MTEKTKDQKDIEDFFKVADIAPREWVNPEHQLECPKCGAGINDLRWPVPGGLRCLKCSYQTAKAQ